MISFLRDPFKIVVLGAGRGGTSLVGSLLNSHPKLSLALELYANDFLVGVSKQAQAASAPERLDLFIKNCHHSAKVANGTWGNKITTEQLDFLLSDDQAELDREWIYKKLLATKKVIYVVRDGRTCVHSKMERAKIDYPTAVARWRSSVAWLKFLQKQPNLSLYTLRFEELLLKPEEELIGLCKFLDLPFANSMLAGVSSDAMATEYRQNTVNAAKAKVPKKALAFTEDLRPELEYLDYL